MLFLSLFLHLGTIISLCIWIVLLMLAYNLFIFLRENKIKRPVGSYASPQCPLEQQRRIHDSRWGSKLSLRVVHKSQAIIDMSLLFTMISFIIIWHLIYNSVHYPVSTYGEQGSLVYISKVQILNEIPACFKEIAFNFVTVKPYNAFFPKYPTESFLTH